MLNIIDDKSYSNNNEIYPDDYAWKRASEHQTLTALLVDIATGIGITNTVLLPLLILL